MKLMTALFLILAPISEAKMNEKELMAGADARIEKFRKADVQLLVLDKNGKPVPHAKVHVEQVNHAFLFGANIYGLFEYSDARQEAAYEQAFTGLLNQATLPFYWAMVEPEDGQTALQEARLEKMARWCAQHQLSVKGHPLIWHEVYPKWGPSEAGPTQVRLKARVEGLVGRFKGLIDRWDVINEATVAVNKADNGVSQWIKRDGVAAVVGQSLDWARAANPQAFLLYNDYNLDKSTEKLVKAVARKIDAVGIQSHMHKENWPLEKIWQICETYSKFGKPLHFTETTVLSGKQMDPGDSDYSTTRKDWNSTPEGEIRQANYVEQFYTLLYSNRHVESITWWDLMDGAWLGAPAGLLRKDLSPKPAYHRLHTLIKGKWWTTTDLQANAQGKAKMRGFLGTYRVAVSGASGKSSGVFELKKGRNTWRLQ